MSDDFDKLLSKLISESKAAKGKKTPTVKKTEKKLLATNIPQQKPYAAFWTDEALILVMQTVKCNSCGNEATSWVPALFIERVNRKMPNPIRQLERLERCQYSSAYGSLPKRIEHREVQACACPHCFGLADNKGSELYSGIAPVQLTLEV